MINPPSVPQFKLEPLPDRRPRRRQQLPQPLRIPHLPHILHAAIPPAIRPFPRSISPFSAFRFTPFLIAGQFALSCSRSPVICAQNQNA